MEYGTSVADPDPILEFDADPDPDPILSFTHVEKSDILVWPLFTAVPVYSTLLYLSRQCHNDANPTESGSTTLGYTGITFVQRIKILIFLV